MAVVSKRVPLKSATVVMSDAKVGIEIVEVEAGDLVAFPIDIGVA